APMPSVSIENEHGPEVHDRAYWLGRVPGKGAESSTRFDSQDLGSAAHDCHAKWRQPNLSTVWHFHCLRDETTEARQSNDSIPEIRATAGVAPANAVAVRETTPPADGHRGRRHRTHSSEWTSGRYSSALRVPRSVPLSRPQSPAAAAVSRL